MDEAFWALKSQTADKRFYVTKLGPVVKVHRGNGCCDIRRGGANGTLTHGPFQTLELANELAYSYTDDVIQCTEGERPNYSRRY